MPSPLLSRVSLTVALVAALAVTAVVARSAGGVFSPGALHAGDSTTVRLGDVRSHAELARDCAACHAGPFSGTPRRARCVHCHTDIQDELADTTSLHGAFALTGSCIGCHTEHRGASGDLTRFEGLGAEHARFGFPLDGGHAKVTCEDCHASSGGKLVYRDTPSTCIGCHEADDTHKGTYGTDCASCHNTTNWEDATFDHEIFPIDHGEEEEGTRSTCATCHTDKSDYTVYTCYGCHEHTPANIEREHRGEVDQSDISDCVACHEGGREDGREGGRGGRDRDESRRRGTPSGDGLLMVLRRSLRLDGAVRDPVRDYEVARGEGSPQTSPRVIGARLR